MSTISAEPYAEKKFLDLDGVRIAYVEQGEGDPIVFQHGNPTSSFLWRNVMPHLEGLGRLIAVDLVGMGDSDKLAESGPGRYDFSEHAHYLEAAWRRLGVETDGRSVLVLHDWGSALGFDWARRHPAAVQAIAYMEAIVAPMRFASFQDRTRERFEALRSERGDQLVLEQNFFVEGMLPGGVIRELTEEEMSVYRKPFAAAGEDRRPTLSWPRQLPIDGDPARVVELAGQYGRWLQSSEIPKLFINAEPGMFLRGPQLEFCRTWANQTEVTVAGRHFVQEDSPHEIGEALAGFVRSLRM